MKFMYQNVSLEHLRNQDPETVTLILDVGKVITNFLDGMTVEQAKRNDAYLRVPPYEGAFRVIGEAVEVFGRVGIVSRCGPVVQEMVESWLQHHELYEKTGFDPRNQYFTRYCEDKAVIVEKEFGGATYFVDDGVHVLEPMANAVEHRLLYGAQKRTLTALPRGIIRVHNWLEVEHYVGLA